MDNLSEEVIDQMFEIIHYNMTHLMEPTITKEEDYRLWRKSFDDNLKKGTRHVLYLQAGCLVGYLSYTVYESYVYINEIEIHHIAQGNGVALRRLALLFASEIAELQVDCLRSYTNKRNLISQKMHEKLGFETEETTPKGIRYKLSKDVFMDRVMRFR